MITEESINAVTLGLTGASGLAYAFTLLRELLKREVQVNLIVSKAAFLVAHLENNLTLPKNPSKLSEYLCDFLSVSSKNLRVYAESDWRAPQASGSCFDSAMVVCPCSSGALAAIANGISDNLIERAADVMLKEKRKLILVHRETPLSLIHLENAVKLAKMGAVIMPANPGFYHKPSNIQDLVDFVVARILDHLGCKHDLMPRWGD